MGKLCSKHDYLLGNDDGMMRDLCVLEAVEHGVAEPDEVVHVGEESAAGPLAAVVHVGRVAQAVVLVAHVIPDDDHGSLH